MFENFQQCSLSLRSSADTFLSLTCGTTFARGRKSKTASQPIFGLTALNLSFKLRDPRREDSTLPEKLIFDNLVDKLSVENNSFQL